MPSYSLEQFHELEDALCKRLLGIDLREASQTNRFLAPEVGSKNPGLACTFSSPGNVSEARSLTSNNWTQTKEVPQPARWNKMWPERAISMVEGETGGLGWALGDFNQDRSAVTQGSLSLPATPAPLSTPTASTSSRYKTELCRTFSERGVCKYGNKCQFAHGADELRCINRHPKYKTEPCRTFHSIGFCPYGIRCHFVHNNEEDDAHARPRPAPQRPPLLKQSFSFAGFPSVLQPNLPQTTFLRTPSVSPPSSSALSDLLTLAFPELSPTMDHSFEPAPQFLPSPDSGCSQGDLTPVFSHLPLAPGQPESCPRRIPSDGASLGPRSLSLASLSDQEGGCSSSASSLSGSDCFEASGRRLPIFSQLSVPDDGSCGEGTSSSVSFFL